MTFEETIAAVIRSELAEMAARHAGPAVLTLQGAADYLATSPSTVRELIDTGDLPCIKVGAQYRIGRRQLDDLLARGASVRGRAVG